MDLALFYKKVEEFLKKWLTKRQKCAGDFISKLIKSPLVNSGKFAIDKEKSNDLHPYAMRWGIETSFRDLKYSLTLSYFHSKKTENILQEVFARLTMYNFAELITSHVVVKQKSRKHLYKINFAAAVHICRNFFLKNISPSDIEALLLMHLLPVCHRSANLRRGSPKAAPSFTYRIP